MHIAKLHISCVLKWSGINLSLYGLWVTASLPISCVLEQLGAYSMRFGFRFTASLHISCVLNRSGITNINRQIISRGFILFMSLRRARVKIYPEMVIYWRTNVSGSQKQLPGTSTVFPSVYFHPQEHTNLAILMDVRQWALILLLLLLSGPCVFHGLRTIIS